MKKKLVARALGILALATIATVATVWFPPSPASAIDCECIGSTYWTPYLTGTGATCTAAHADWVSQAVASTSSKCSSGTCENQHYLSDCYDCGQGQKCKSGRMSYRCLCCNPACMIQQD